MTLKYDWTSLQKQGDWLVVEGSKPINIRSTVSAYILRHMPAGTICVTREIPTGTFVSIAYIPSISEVHQTQVEKHVVADDPDQEIRQYLDD